MATPKEQPEKTLNAQISDPYDLKELLNLDSVKLDLGPVHHFLFVSYDLFPDQELLCNYLIGVGLGEQLNVGTEGKFCYPDNCPAGYRDARKDSASRLKHAVAKWAAELYRAFPEWVCQLPKSL